MTDVNNVVPFGAHIPCAFGNSYVYPIWCKGWNIQPFEVPSSKIRVKPKLLGEMMDLIDSVGLSRSVIVDENCRLLCGGKLLKRHKKSALFICFPAIQIFSLTQAEKLALIAAYDNSQ